MFVRVGPRLLIVLSCLLLAGGLAGWSWYTRAAASSPGRRLTEAEFAATLLGATPDELHERLGQPDTTSVSRRYEGPVESYHRAFREPAGDAWVVADVFYHDGRVLRVRCGGLSNRWYPADFATGP